LCDGSLVISCGFSSFVAPTFFSLTLVAFISVAGEVELGAVVEVLSTPTESGAELFSSFGSTQNGADKLASS
jgi:hypothetical protein